MSVDMIEQLYKTNNNYRQTEDKFYRKKDIACQQAADQLQEVFPCIQH